MFDYCCGSNWSECLKGKLEYNVEETDNGIRIEVVPKDPDKKQAFQNLVKACKDFCGTESSTCC